MYLPQALCSLVLDINADDLQDVTSFPRPGPR
jgi:hypothetical protein